MQDIPNFDTIEKIKNDYNKKFSGIFNSMYEKDSELVRLTFKDSSSIVDLISIGRSLLTNTKDIKMAKAKKAKKPVKKK